jgi:hypothetical protein
MSTCRQAATQGIVAIEVVGGTDKVKFRVHQALPVGHAEYFQNALRGS